MGNESSERLPIFVSHISREHAVAALMKRMLEKDFKQTVELFTSSDISSIRGGENWLDAIRKAMDSARAVVVLCSKESVQKPWVQFELGAAWIRRVPIIPVCHSGMQLIDLPLPLSLQQGVELGPKGCFERLYASIANGLGWPVTPAVSELATRVRELKEAEVQYTQVQFERYFDIFLPSPGQLDEPVIPDDARVESNEESFRLFGYLGNGSRTWGDIVKAAAKRTDRRWVKELQRCVHMASRREDFRPVQAIYHTNLQSYQPQLSRMESTATGERRFHVHLVETVVAPLSEVPNKFGLMATLLRLGLRFRHEVIERCYLRLRSGSKQIGMQAVDADMLAVLRTAVENIETDALSRGSEKMEPDAIAGLFEREAEQDEMGKIQSEWKVVRDSLFRSDAAGDAPLSYLDVYEIIKRMRDINFRFMTLGTKRFHEMVVARGIEVTQD